MRSALYGVASSGLDCLVTFDTLSSAGAPFLVNVFQENRDVGFDSILALALRPLENSLRSTREAWVAS